MERSSVLASWNAADWGDAPLTTNIQGAVTSVTFSDDSRLLAVTGGSDDQPVVLETGGLTVRGPK